MEYIGSVVLAENVISFVAESNYITGTTFIYEFNSFSYAQIFYISQINIIPT